MSHGSALRDPSPSSPAWKNLRTRREAIAELVLREGTCDVATLAEHTGASQATIRRDLIALEGQGVLTRTWGGAEVRVAVKYGEAFERRAAHNREAKRAIAVAAAAMVKPNMVIGLSGGATCTLLGRILRGRSINVVTNAVNLPVEFFGARHTKVIVTGGSLKANSYELVGAAADAIIRNYHLDLVFFSCSGVDELGFTRRDHAEAAVVRTFRSVADTSVVLVDHGKVGRANPARVAEFGEVDVVICDDGTKPEWLERYGREGAEVRIARVRPERAGTERAGNDRAGAADPHAPDRRS